MLPVVRLTADDRPGEFAASASANDFEKFGIQLENICGIDAVDICKIVVVLIVFLFMFGSLFLFSGVLHR